MKPISFKPHQLRRLFSLLCLALIASVFIFSPIISPLSQFPQPGVKAAFSFKPVEPISSGLNPPDITATSVYILDLESSVVLYQKNPHQRLAPASLTKIVTALVSLDYYSPDSVLLVKNGQRSTGSTVDLLRGDEVTALDLLYALLVPSGNDAAVTLAENYPGSYQAFIGKMNSKTQALGLENSYFSNVSGVESSNHYTTAHDITLLAKSALERPLFAQIVSTQKVTLKSLKGNLYPLETTNILLGKPGFFGVKTGWTPQAGECLVVLFEKDGHPVLLSLLNSKDRFGEAQLLSEWVSANFSWE